MSERHNACAVLQSMRQRIDALESSEEKLDGFFGLKTIPRHVRRRCIYETMHPHQCALLNSEKSWELVD